MPKDYKPPSRLLEISPAIEDAPRVIEQLRYRGEKVNFSSGQCCTDKNPCRSAYPAYADDLSKLVKA